MRTMVMNRFRKECSITFPLYTFLTSNFGNALGGTGVLGKGFAGMELARAYRDVFTASFDGHPCAEF